MDIYVGKCDIRRSLMLNSGDTGRAYTDFENCPIGCALRRKFKSTIAVGPEDVEIGHKRYKILNQRGWPDFIKPRMREVKPFRITLEYMEPC